LNVEQAVPVEATPATQGKAAGKDGKGESRRRLPPSEKSSDEKSLDEMAEPEDDPPEDDPPQRRVDSLA
jgi:hypothetical protein